jgi:response regulator RpfG family c-di-GMP phosphodiesterase
MPENNGISLYDFYKKVSEIVDWISPAHNRHQKRTAYIACNIALKMGMAIDEVQDIIIAAMLLDIGASSNIQYKKIISFDSYRTEHDNHAEIGSRLLKGFAPLEKAALIIKYHHTDFDPPKNNVPLGSYIIHLADRVSTLFDERQETSEQIRRIYRLIETNFFKFHPDVINAFIMLKDHKHLWAEAFSVSFGSAVLKDIRCGNDLAVLESLKSFTKIMTRIMSKNV